MKTFNAIDKDKLLARLRAERRRIESQFSRHQDHEPICRYDFAILAIESEPSERAITVAPPERTI